ncbi:MAG: hypothetical protein Q6370_012960 [Candidatus Sigynarchaeota archaeon]
MSKDGKMSLIDFSTSKSEFNGVITLFLEAKLVFQEDIVVNGVFHAFKDKLVHGIIVSENPVINILMHIFSTNQIGVIKQYIIPDSFHKPREVNDGVVMIIVYESENVQDITDIISAFNNHFSYQPIQPQYTPFLMDGALFHAWVGHDEPRVEMLSERYGVADWLIKVAAARMAIFSLTMQQKN